MSLHEPFGHVRSHLHTVQDAFYALGRVVENLCGTADGFLSHGIASLIEKEAKG